MKNSEQEKCFIPQKLTAVLIDLSFFLKRYRTLYTINDPKEMARRIRDYAYKLIKQGNDLIYRVYIYDCKPSKNTFIYPISKQQYHLGTTEHFIFRDKLLKELKNQPYFALRLGDINDRTSEWKFKNYKTIKDLLQGKISITDLKDEDFVLDMRQKGVDMRIGLDMAHLANKKQAEKIILVTADSDFIPAIKYVRKEGVIVQLDAMHHNFVSKDLLEHIDLLNSVFSKDK